MTDMTQAQIVIDAAPLAYLYLHPLNTRTEPPALDISTLADSILACGLLQNLLVYLDPAREGLGVVAGGRRLRALQLLAGSGQWSGHIPCQLTHDPLIAQTWANAENTARTALHPADEIRAYGRMAATGADPVTIARAFAVTEAHVRRRLRLAGLPDAALDALKSGQISLGQTTALTVSDDPERIAAALAYVIDHPNHNESAIRQMLIDTTIRATDRRARFVTVDLYEASGGKTTRDLFSDNIWLHDDVLLNSLFARRLDDEAARLRGEGWAFVLTSPEANIHDDPRFKAHDMADPDPVDLPEGDAEELESLSETPYWQRDDDQRARHRELTDRARGSFDDEARVTMGCFIHVNWDGGLEVLEGLREKPKPGQDDDAGGPASKTVAPAAEAISDTLRQDFLTIRRAALQTALLAKPELLLDLAAFQLYWRDQGHSPSGSLQISVDAQNVTPSVADNLALVPALAAERPHGDWTVATPADLAAFRDQPGAKKLRNEVLTRHLARSAMAVPGDLTTAIEALAGADIRKIWSPTAANCFARMPGPALPEIYAELLEPEDGDERFTAFRAMKKRDQARELEDLFSNLAVREAYGISRETGTRIDAWVPAGMRG